MIRELTKFADMWISVSLLNPRTKKRAEELNCHTCTRKSCYKYTKNCRFRYPRFPILETLVSVPARIKYTDTKIGQKKIAEAKKIKNNVMTILENKEFMANNINSIGKEHLEKYMEIKTKICHLEDIVNLFKMKIGKLIYVDVDFPQYMIKIIKDVSEYLKEDDEFPFKNKIWSTDLFRFCENK